MPRCSKDSRNKKSSRLQVEELYRKCRYCNANRPTNRFDKHQKVCKTRWEILQERGTCPMMQLLIDKPEFVQGSSTMLVDSDVVDDLPVHSPSITDLDNFATDSETSECRCVLWDKLGSKIMCRMYSH